MSSTEAVKHMPLIISFLINYYISLLRVLSRRFLQAIPSNYLFLETCIKRYTQMLTKRHTSREQFWIFETKTCGVTSLTSTSVQVDWRRFQHTGLELIFLFFLFLFEKHASKALLMNNNKETCRRITDKTSGGNIF